MVLPSATQQERKARNFFEANDEHSRWIPVVQKLSDPRSRCPQLQNPDQQEAANIDAYQQPGPLHPSWKGHDGRCNHDEGEYIDAIGEAGVGEIPYGSLGAWHCWDSNESPLRSASPISSRHCSTM